jgi:regulator of sigma E protease
MNALHTVVWFLVAIAILVVVHELGHYLAARLAGVKVLRFSIGFGKPLWSRRAGADGTEWVISALPFGGYVKMLDAREGAVAPAEAHRSFDQASVWRRMGIVVAGPLANFLLAILLYWAVFLHGVPAIRPVLGAPPADTPAAAAGLVAGDEVARVDETAVQSFQDLRLALLRAGVAKDAVTLVLKNGRRVTLDTRIFKTANLEHDPLAALGITRFDPPVPPVIGQVVADSVAARAGLKAGDRVVAVDGNAIASWQDLVRQVREAPERRLELTVLRGGATLAVRVTPQAVDEQGRRVGKIGAAPRVDEATLAALVTEVKYGPLDAALAGVKKTWEMSAFTLEMMGRMVLGQVSWKNLSGPLTIADFAGQSASLGWLSFIGFLALVSVSLGVLNLLPVPLLDGGHLLYHIAELVTGRPVPERVMELGNRIGMALLFLLMGLALYNDLQRLISG